MDMGQGLDTILRQIVVETLGLTVDRINVGIGDTDVCPWDAGAHASRSTFVAGNSALYAAQQVREQKDPKVIGGKPCIKGTRVTVGTVVGSAAGGRTIDEVLEAYPYLVRADVLQALTYAAWRAEEREFSLSAT